MIGLSELEGIRTRRPVWRDVEERHGQLTEPPQPNDSEPRPLPAGLRVIACVLFLVFSIAMWAALPAALYVGLFFIPNLICAEHIAGKLFGESFGKSISDEDFSVLRIAVGALLSLLLLIMLGGLAALAVWLLS